MQSRNIRSIWERGYLKDLYHRRILAGAEPELHRSAFPNWNYNAEIFALSHRLSVPEINKQELVNALTFSDYLERDLSVAAVDINGFDRMSLEESDEKMEDNSQLIEKGTRALNKYLNAYLRYHLPNAPEEFIIALSSELSSDEFLSKISESFGLNHLIRTKEYPISKTSLANSFLSIIGAVSNERAWELIKNNVIPNILSIPIDNVYPLANPLPVLDKLLKLQNNIEEVEARLVGKIGEMSSMPCFIVGIYANKKLFSQMAGESLDIAENLAATEGLLKLWGISNDKQFLFGNQITYDDIQENFKENYSLSKIFDDKLSLKLLTQNELHEEPLKMINLIENYKTSIEPIVGIPLRKRLRHKFSRGSLYKRSFRYLVKPKVYTVS
uniref:Large ribosomal subunit protein mL44 n=1 Tax=Parastrongyloides trichosuri TaxID=131310 RepID=A0A0N4ZUQ5_PARTI